MKNILVLNYEFPPLGGGASPVSYEIAKGYVDLGHHVDVVTMGYKGLPRYEVKDGINIYRVKCLRSKKEICYPREQLTYLFSAYFRARKLIKKHKYDICHCHFIIPTGVLAWMLKRKFGLEYIITAHGSDVLGYNPRFKRLYPLLIRPRKAIIKNAKYIISPSNFLKEEISKAYGADSKKFVVIPNGIEEGKFTPMKKEKYILLVSRLFVNKGIQDFLYAIKDIDLKDWKVKIVGEGPYKSELEKIVNKNKIKNIEFLGRVDNKSQRMKELYGKASIFCQPSHFENASIVLLEAMQSGCALVARSVGGNPETVDNIGLFEDTNKLKDILNHFIDDERILKQTQHKNIQKVKSFEWKKIILEYNKVL